MLDGVLPFKAKNGTASRPHVISVEQVPVCMGLKTSPLSHVLTYDPLCISALEPSGICTRKGFRVNED